MAELTQMTRKTLIVGTGCTCSSQNQLAFRLPGTIAFSWQQDWLQALASTINRLFERQQLTSEEVLMMGEQLVSIVRAIHERDILHRDICPRNIISLFNDDRRLISVRLIEFGLASYKKYDDLYPVSYPSNNVFCSSCAHGAYICLSVNESTLLIDKVPAAHRG